MIRRQTLEETLETMSLFGCGTAVEESYCDIDRIVVTLDAFSENDHTPPEETLRLLREKLFYMARRLEATSEARSCPAGPSPGELMADRAPMSSREQHTVNLGALAVTLYLVGAALTVIGIVWQYTSDGPWGIIVGLRGLGLVVAGLTATVAATACAICARLKAARP